MKKIIIVSLVMLTVLSFAFAQGNAETKSAAAPSKDDFHIGIVTGTVSQSEDDLRGAEALISEYGSVADACVNTSSQFHVE